MNHETVNPSPQPFPDAPPLPEETTVPLGIPQEGADYKIVDSSDDQHIKLQMEDFTPRGLEVISLTKLETRLPLTTELFKVERTKSGHKVTLPTAEGLNNFSETHLQPLGATTMRVEQVRGGDLPVEQIVDHVADGIIPIASDNPEFYFHDVSDHALGAITLEETTSQVFRRIAQISQSLRAHDPDAAQSLARSMAQSFDRQTSVQARYLQGVRNYREEPMLLSGLFDNVTFYDNKAVKAAIETVIDDAPRGAREQEGATKLERWARWESENMPAYGAKITAKLAERPRTNRLQVVARALTGLFSRER